MKNHPLFMVACNKVAGDWRETAYAIMLEDAYASHVSQDTKIHGLAARLAYADQIQRGVVNTFTIWQRINYVLTGQCVPFLPAVKSNG
mgnify:CR=1 FL=1